MCSSAIVAVGCGGLPPQTPSAGHIGVTDAGAKAPIKSEIPRPVAASATLPRPKPASKTETYSVSVRNVAVEELLFALARDSKVNIDLHPGIHGTVTINAIDQTLQQILTRIAKQIDMRWELDGPNLAVMPDAPFLRTYKVDYVNMSRDVNGMVSINTQIASTSTSAVGTTGTTTTGGNSSTTTVKSEAKNHFWDSLDKNLKDILRETDKILPEGSSETVIEKSESQSASGIGALVQTVTQSGANSRTTAAQAATPTSASAQNQGATTVRRTTFREAASVIINPEAGIVVVRATARQHEKVHEYIDLVTSNARRQVIIEATIAEVSLSDAYKQGINWQSLRAARQGSPSAGFSLAQQAGQGIPVIGNADNNAFSFLLNYVSPGLGISSTLSLLETFGNVKVLSSPKISVLNNQTAMLKVVDNIVYFTVKTDAATTTNGTTSPPTTTATPQTVSVGLVMSVTPQISDSGSILLNVRPSISSTKGEGKQDPTPGLPIKNMIPEIQTREMESVLRLADGEIAVMGGLMEDRANYGTNAVPGIGGLPVIGNLFKSRDDSSTKTELVIFLKPTIIRNPSINGDYSEFSSLLPRKEFLERTPRPASNMESRP
jgi:MSHA type pilus biogenesis protein MshL